jgi:fermentation-respiration switch protein FrsA (DUF1100 family)
MLLCGTACAQTGPAESFSTAQIPLIFPGMEMQGTEEAKYEVPEGGERVELRAPGGERIEALFCPATTAAGDDAAHRPTVIYFYGNAQCIAYALPQVDLFRRCGANVLVADYLGYGLSEGKPSEAGCYATADALYEYALRRKDVDRTKLVSAGWSLGAAVAIDLASRKQMAGLITFSGYTSKRELAKRQFPDVPPSAIEHPFLSIDKIGKITCPTLIVHGRRDTLVPFEMSEQLRRASAGTPVEYLPIDGAGHNDLFRVGAEQIKDAVAEFLDRLTNQPGSRPAENVQ